MNISHSEIADLLRDFSGPDWYRQSDDPGLPDTLPDPSGQIFRELFDLDEIQEIQDVFANATGVASIITTTSGVPVTAPSNFCRLCRDVIRVTERGLENCIRSDAEIGRYNSSGPIIQPCLSGGLWDAGASIRAGRIHIANWLIGQVRNEETDAERMRRYALDIGADPDEFLSALNEVTVMSTEQFRQVGKALFLMANQMSRIAYQNLQNDHLIADLGRAENVINKSHAVAFIWRNAPGWPVDYVTANVESLLGVSVDDLVSGRISYAEMIHADDLERVGAEVTRHARNEAVTEFANEPYRLVTKEGKVKWVNNITSVIKDGNGAVTGFEGIVIDITERMEFARQKETLEAQLQRAQKMEMIGTLAGGVAHDLNNILGGIIGYPELILQDLPADSRLRTFVEEIQKSGERAAEVVQDLLTLARRGVVVKETVNLNTIVKGYLSSPEARKLFEQTEGIEMILDLDDDLFNILGSPFHLSKTVMNLVMNAAESMPRGGKIRLRTRNEYCDRERAGIDNVAEGDYAVFAITDEGVGIPKEYIEKIFEPFYTRKTMGRSGTGLGMPVVWGTIKDHDGCITVESEENRGSTFTLYFPVTREETRKSDLQFAIDDYKGKGERVLVVDDVTEQRRVATSLLTLLGYRVSTVSSGEEAVDFLAHNSFDLILLDMIMDPGIDGLETYRRIREIHPGQKTVIASGYTETDRVRQAQELGAGSYLKKPYTLARLAVAIRRELERETVSPCADP